MMRRTRVVGPEEPTVDPDYYDNATGHAPLNHTAFRQAERRYKKRPLDRTDLLDFDTVPCDGDQRVRVVGEFEGKRVYEFTGHPGFLYIPRALDAGEQTRMARECMHDWINPPNISNLDAHYSFDNLRGFLDAHDGGHLLAKCLATGEQLELTTKLDIQRFIKKLRWVTLGYHYDWTSKQYDMTRLPNPIPHLLSKRAKEIAAGATTFTDTTGHQTAMNPEAGIINYYQPGDTLTGHVDRSEQTMSVPLVSISLGLSAVFLVGGADRDDPVSAVLVRSGDVSLLTGEARRYYHGVPRVLEGTAPDHFTGDPFLSDSRININLRQVL